MKNSPLDNLAYFLWGLILTVFILAVATGNGNKGLLDLF